MATKAKDYERVIRRPENGMVMSNEYCTPMRLVSRFPGFHAFRSCLRVLNISAAGAELDIHPSQPLAFLPCDHVDYVEAEIDTAFAHAFSKPPLAAHTSWPFEEESFDVVLSIAGLHHFTHEERRSIYAQCRRVLRQDGALVIGDVKKGSWQASFLNGFVDAHTETGHRGLFFEEGGPDHESLSAIFETVRCTDQCYDWEFTSVLHRTRFCKELFRLQCSDEELSQHLHDASPGPNLPWMLTYFVASRT